MTNSKMKKRYQKWAFIFTLPNIILFILFFAIPAILGIALSFTNYNGFKMMDFIGLKNYIDLFNDEKFYRILFQTILYVICVVPLIYVSSLLTALLFTSKHLVFKSMTRVLVYMPTLFSTVMVGLTWRWIFGEKFGLVNHIIVSMGYEPISWSINPQAAFITTLVAFVWASTGFFMLIFIGGIENIDPLLYEAATIDGANSIDKLFYITIPQLKPITLLVIVLNTINAFKVFAVVVSLTNGGPGYKTTYMIQYIYQTGFERSKIGYASAVSMVMFVILLILSLVQFKINNRKEG